LSFIAIEILEEEIDKALIIYWT